MSVNRTRCYWRIGLVAWILSVASIQIVAAKEWDMVQNAMSQNQRKTAEFLLKKAVNAGPVNADLAYNLGTVYLMQDNLGEAVWYLETAKVLRPRDRAIRQNLAAAHQRVRMEPMTLVWDAVLEWGRWISIGEAAWICLSVAAVFSVALLLSVVGRFRRNWVIVIGSICVLVAVPMGIRIWDGLTPRAVVVADRFQLKVSAHSDAITISDVPGGTVCRITEFSVGWLQIQLPDGAIGWGSRDDIRLL